MTTHNIIDDSDKKPTHRVGNIYKADYDGNLYILSQTGYCAVSLISIASNSNRSKEAYFVKDYFNIPDSIFQEHIAGKGTKFTKVSSIEIKYKI